MRIPIRNKSDRPLTVFVEVQCDQFEVPAGGEAIVRLADGRPHSIDVDGDWITIWDEEGDASVEVIAPGDKHVDDALMLVRAWLHRMGAQADAMFLDDLVDGLEPETGYRTARDRVFQAFHQGFAGHDAPPRANEAIIRCWRIGGTAARLNEAARKARTFPELGAAAPFDTDTMRAAFDRALGSGG